MMFTDKFPLTHKNYHSLEANRHFLSNSQYASFMKCESMTMAMLNGKYTPVDSKALIAGSLFHAWLDDSIEEFMSKTPSLFKKTGGLYAEYQAVMDMIEFAKQDELIMFVLKGEKEVIITAEMFGTPWKIRFDSYNPAKKRFAELKSTKSIRDLTWDPEAGEKVSFIELYNYPRQHAIYSEIERIANGRPAGDWYEGIMVAISKEDPPDKEVISLKDNGRVQMELEAIKNNMPRILAVKNGEVEPARCERCAYCRGTKKLDRIIHYSELDRRKI